MEASKSATSDKNGVWGGKEGHVEVPRGGLGTGPTGADLLQKLPLRGFGMIHYGLFEWCVIAGCGCWGSSSMKVGARVLLENARSDIRGGKDMKTCDEDLQESLKLEGIGTQWVVKNILKYIKRVKIPKNWGRV